MMTKPKEPWRKRESIEITRVRFCQATPTEAEAGHLGYVSCVVGDILCLDGISLRRTLNGRLTLSFPGRYDCAGRRHYYVRPLDDRSRLDIEHQVLQALGIEEGAPR